MGQGSSHQPVPDDLLQSGESGPFLAVGDGLGGQNALPDAQGQAVVRPYNAKKKEVKKTYFEKKKK